MNSEREYDALSLSLDRKMNEHEDAISKLEFERHQCESNFNDVQAKYNKLKSEFDSKSEELETKIEYSNSHIKGLDAIIKEREDICIALDKEMLERRDDIKRAEFQAGKVEDEAREKVEDIKSRYSKWKVNVLAEVAKMQLKNKVDTIDKAGLSEILNG